MNNLNSDKQFIIFSDFDNTITNHDILDKVITDIYSWDKYKEVESLLLSDKLKYEQYLHDMFDGIEYKLTNIPRDIVDSTFADFYLWVKASNIDFYIVSSGFKKIIQHLVPDVDQKLIFGNDIEIDANNKWTVRLYDSDNNCSTNKNQIIKSINNCNYKTIFIGDGLSDFKVMGNVDYLFCKANSLLHTKCIDENCAHIVFNDFSQVMEQIKKIVY